MAAPENKLKTALLAGEVLKGPWLSLGSEAVAEIVGRAGFGYCLIDAEHGPFDPVGIAGQLRALEATGTPTAVRVPGHDDWILKQVLDAGAQTIMVPVVNTSAQAEAVVDASLYPPGGRRGLGGANMRAGGFGAIPDYPATANDQICLIAQIESVEAVDNIEAIAGVKGIDALFVGPSDLGCDMGFTHDLGSDSVWQAVEEAITRIAATGKVAGVFAGPDRAASMIAAGARFLGTGVDAGLLTAAMQAHAKALG
jgi:4-hydroxy-2-oxoheptanedioate aldolase